MGGQKQAPVTLTAAARLCSQESVTLASFRQQALRNTSDRFDYRDDHILVAAVRAIHFAIAIPGV